MKKWKYENLSFQQMVLEPKGIHTLKKKKKKQLKMDHRPKGKAYKTSRKHRRKFSWQRLGKDFLDIPQKAWTIKETKNDKRPHQN